MLQNYTKVFWSTKLTFRGETPMNHEKKTSEKNYRFLRYTRPSGIRSRSHPADYKKPDYTELLQVRQETGDDGLLFVRFHKP